MHRNGRNAIRYRVLNDTTDLNDTAVLIESEQIDEKQFHY